MSKYKTRRQQRRTRIRNTIKKVILITASLTILAIAAFIYLKVKNREPGIDTNRAAQQNNSERKNDSAQMHATQSPIAMDTVIVKDSKGEEKIKTAILQNDSNVKEDLPIKVAEKNKGKTPDTARVIPTETDKEKQEIIKLTREQMMAIVQDILAKKARINNRSNCVTIRKTSTSNVENVFDIADLLKHNRFIISGRETVSAASKGVQIDAEGSCIILTIGIL